jgi:hypothetical protein
MTRDPRTMTIYFGPDGEEILEKYRKLEEDSKVSVSSMVALAARMCFPSFDAHLRTDRKFRVKINEEVQV